PGRPGTRHRTAAPLAGARASPAPGWLNGHARPAAPAAPAGAPEFPHVLAVMLIARPIQVPPQVAQHRRRAGADLPRDDPARRRHAAVALSRNATGSTWTGGPPAAAR